MKVLRNLFICILSVLLVFCTVAYGDEADEQKDYRSILRTYGRSVSESSLIQKVELKTSEGDLCEAFQITDISSHGTTVSICLLYETDVNGKEHFVTLSDLNNAKAASGGTRNNVTASAYYTTRTINGTTVYRPYKLEVVSNGTTKFTISYQAAGGRYTLSGSSVTGGGAHNITISKNPPVSGQVYSTTSYASYYYNVRSGFIDVCHQIEFRVGSLATAYYYLPPYSNS